MGYELRTFWNQFLKETELADGFLEGMKLQISNETSIKLHFEFLLKYEYTVEFLS